MRILLVEDEPSLQLSLSDRLESEGHTVTVEGDGDAGFERARSESFDIVLLDVMLPGRGGFDVCRDLRQAGVETPILMLTARGQVIDRVLGLKLGADDYLVKPFDMLELSARIEAITRRVRTVGREPSERASFGDVSVDFRRAEVSRGGQPLELSALEFKLLRYFIEHRGELLSRDRLLDEVWGYEATPQTRTVDVHVAGLRQKIEEKPSHPRHIVTVYGLGYKFAS